ncbi:MAG: hypothetical protein SGBAC_003779 [Bacillariaceae sp.]
MKWPNPLSVTSPAMYFIHVGKAGGMTLRVHLPVPLAKNKKELICWQRNESNASNCLTARKNNDSVLSNHIRGHMHIGSSFFSPNEQEFLMDHTDTFLFSIRNPIDRVISAFYYHQNQQKKKIKYPLFECFHSIGELMDSLAKIGITRTSNTKDSMNQSDCSQLARRVLQGNTTAGGAHFAYNYEYYQEETISKKPNHLVAVIRAERLWQDAKDLDQMVGGSGILQGDGQRYTHYYPTTSEVQEEGTTTTTTTAAAKSEIIIMNNTKGLSSLCCVLAREIAVYVRLLSLAVNLKPSEKQVSLQQVQEQCGGGTDIIPITAMLLPAAGPQSTSSSIQQLVESYSC